MSDGGHERLTLKSACLLSGWSKPVLQKQGEQYVGGAGRVIVLVRIRSGSLTNYNSFSFLD